MRRGWGKWILLVLRLGFGGILIAASIDKIQHPYPFAEIVDKYYTDLSIDDVKVCVRYALDIITSEEIHIREVG